MIPLPDGAFQKIINRCHNAGSPLTLIQRKAIKAVIEEVLSLAPNDDQDVVWRHRFGELTEGEAAYWLGVDRSRLRELVKEQELGDG